MPLTSLPLCAHAPIRSCAIDKGRRAAQALDDKSRPRRASISKRPGLADEPLTARRVACISAGGLTPSALGEATHGRLDRGDVEGLERSQCVGQGRQVRRRCPGTPTASSAPPRRSWSRRAKNSRPRSTSSGRSFARGLNSSSTAAEPLMPRGPVLRRSTPRRASSAARGAAPAPASACA